MKDKKPFQWEWLYAIDFPQREELWKFVKELEEAGEFVIVDDNWNIIYQTPIVTIS